VCGRRADSDDVGVKEKRPRAGSLEKGAQKKRLPKLPAEVFRHRGLWSIPVGLRVLEFEPQVDTYGQRKEDEFDEFEIISLRLFLSSVDLPECSFAGFVDEFIRGVFHTCVA